MKKLLIFTCLCAPWFFATRVEAKKVRNKPASIAHLSPAQTYAHQYATIQRRMNVNLDLLMKDFELAWRPKTFGENSNAHSSDNFDSGIAYGDDATRRSVRNDMEYEYFKTEEGKIWKNNRSSKRISLRKALNMRLLPIKIDALRLGTLSPVPDSMRDAHATVVQYSKAIEATLNSLEQEAYRGSYYSWNNVSKKLVIANGLMKSAAQKMGAPMTLNPSSQP